MVGPCGRSSVGSVDAMSLCWVGDPRAFISIDTIERIEKILIFAFTFRVDAALIRLNPQRSLQLLTTQSLLLMKTKKNNDIFKALFSSRLS
jgi:hypothetical protein